jgi:hypothetical protein
MRQSVNRSVRRFRRRMMSKITTTRKIAFCICLIAMPCTSQSPQTTPPTASSATPPAASRYAGCVLRSGTDKDTVVLSGEAFCAKLTGTFSAEKLVGHEVDLKGVLTDGTASIPATIRVGSVTSVGKSCSDVCSLLPPGRRGLKKGDYPGKEGGTPGMAPTKPPQ